MSKTEFEKRVNTIKKQGIRQSYSVGPYNKFNDKEQWIRLSQGCPNGCPFCYEPKEEIVFEMPEIVRKDVKIMDMNLLSKTEAGQIIDDLGKKRVNNRVIHYELVCGIDHRYLTYYLAWKLKTSRFEKIRLAWDFGYADQKKIKAALKTLMSVGYNNKDIMIFMICNWQIAYQECFQKLYLCAVWNCKVCDCYFDGQVSPNIEPIGWSQEEIILFRKQVRKHNQLVNFRVDPELKGMPTKKALPGQMAIPFKDKNEQGL